MLCRTRLFCVAAPVLTILMNARLCQAEILQRVSSKLVNAAPSAAVRKEKNPYQ